MTIHTFKDTNQEWLDLRKNYITATEAAILFRMGFKSVSKLVEDKLGLSKPFKENDAMRNGKILEPAVLNCFKYHMGLDAEPAHPTDILVATNDEYRLSATPDGVIRYPKGDVIVECKTTSCKMDTWLKGIPQYYLIQVHVQLCVCEMSTGLIGAMQYTPDLPFIAYEVKASKEINDILLKEAKRFWHCFDNDLIFECDEVQKIHFKKLLADSYKMVYYSK